MAFGLRCLEVHEETQPQQQENDMTIDLNDAGSQQDDPFPSGIYRLRARLKAGTAGTDHLLVRAKNGVSLMLGLECIVVEGEHHGRKVWDYISCELDEADMITRLAADKLENLRASVRYGRKRLKAIIDSAFNLDPHDTGEAAQAKRRFEGYDFFDGIVFWAQVDEQPAGNGYRASNKINFIITNDLPDYPKTAAPVSTLPVPQKKRDDMVDEIPF
jgi:hypothetical protein